MKSALVSRPARRRLAVGAITSGAVLLLAACVPYAPAPAGAGAGATTPKTAATEVTLVGTEFKLEPATITVPAGQPVRLTFVNKGAIEHDWEADGFTASNVRVVATSAGLAARLAEAMAQKAGQGIVHPMAGAGQQVTIEFTPTAAGTYPAACQIPGHKEAGMRGTLVVR